MSSFTLLRTAVKLHWARCIRHANRFLLKSGPSVQQAASVEPSGMARLVRDIRDIEAALGDGIKKVYDSEIGQRQKLRKVKNINSAV